MSNELHASLTVRVLSVTFFSILTIGALAWFLLSSSNLISKFILHDPVVGFDKGSMYMLGGGLALLLLSVVGVIQGILKLRLNKKNEVLFTKALVVSLFIMFSFPHLAQYLVSNYADKNNYSICSDVTYRWALYGKFYYTKNKHTCDALVAEKAMKKRSYRR